MQVKIWLFRQKKMWVTIRPICLLPLPYITATAKLAIMNIKEMEYNAEKAAELMTMMSNPNRLLILCQLLDGEKCVMELAEAVGLSQSALSQHLAKLRGGKLVATRRDAQTINYSLASNEVAAVMTVLYNIYCATDVVDASGAPSSNCRLR